MTWSDVDWTATEAVVGRIQDRIFRAAQRRLLHRWCHHGITSGWDTERQRLEPDAEQSARPVLRGAPDSDVGRLPDAYANRYSFVPPRKPRRPYGPRTGEATCRQLKPREQWIAISVPAIVDQETWDRAQ